MTCSPGSWRRWCPLCAPRLDFRCQVSSGARVATRRTPPRAVRRALVAPMTLAAAPRTRPAGEAAQQEAKSQAAANETRRLASDADARRRAGENELRRQASDAESRRQTEENEVRHRARAGRARRTRRRIASAGTRRLAPRRSGAQERRVRQSTRWRCTAGSGAERASRSKQRKPTTSDAEAAVQRLAAERAAVLQQGDRGSVRAHSDPARRAAEMTPGAHAVPRTVRRSSASANRSRSSASSDTRWSSRRRASLVGRVPKLLAL